MKYNRSVLLIIIAIFIALITGCTSKEVQSNSEINSREWELIEGSAEATSVTMYHNYTALDAVNFLETTLPARVKETTGIDLKVSYKSRTDIYEKLISDQMNERKNGGIDLILIDGVGLKPFYDKELIYGPFLSKLPNYYNFINPDSIEAHYAEGMDLNDFAAPFGRRQFVMTLNEDNIEDAPLDFDELMAYIQAEKGRFTIPMPPNQVGVKFIETLVCNIEGWEKVNELPADKEAVKNAIASSIDYMTKMKPYLWKEGTIFPASETELDTLFTNDEVMFAMSMDQNHATNMLYEDNYPEGARSFILGDGTVGTTSYMMIPFNSGNKSGAMVVINDILSPELQGMKYNPKTWGDLPAIDTKIMDTEVAKPITKNTIKRSSIKESVLMDSRLPNVRKEISDILVEIWFEIMG
ncbi:MAG: ABC transporter substrate-binding protein [Clostridia bacterium]|nr:ABC transporter substrate-binding protein [Clostridia bacterium]